MLSKIMMFKPYGVDSVRHLWLFPSWTRLNSRWVCWVDFFGSGNFFLLRRSTSSKSVWSFQTVLLRFIKICLIKLNFCKTKVRHMENVRQLHWYACCSIRLRLLFILQIGTWCIDGNFLYWKLSGLHRAPLVHVRHVEEHSFQRYCTRIIAMGWWWSLKILQSQRQRTMGQILSGRVRNQSISNRRKKLQASLPL